MRLVCRSFAAQVAPTPAVVLVMYWTKYLLLFVGGWAFFVSFSSFAPSLASSGSGFLSFEWVFRDDAFQKFILWAIFYESAGFGCSMGPMNARFKPPIGGFLYFLRPGTTKLPLFPGLPVVGGMRRTLLDVVLYAANMAFLLRALLSPEITPDLLLPSFVLIGLLAVVDKTLFLAARSEHYWIALACLTFAGGDFTGADFTGADFTGDLAGGSELWVSACKLVWACVWFWAATSKLNDHFPSVIMVMMNNGPFFPKALKRRLFAGYPDDLRPSQLARFMARMGTATEYAIPFVLIFSESALLTGAMLFVMFCFHGFIALNNPSGMPIEWNILMVYGGIFLFGFHPEAIAALGAALGAAPALLAFILLFGVAIPAYGNFVPSRVSFLMAMRYYAGNWAYNVWLFRPEAISKLDRLTRLGGTLREQLTDILPEGENIDAAMTLMMAHRFMHLEGRPLLEALPQAVDDIDAYEWIDGEIFGGNVIGWNFGDGHLNGEQLLTAVQAQCGFEPGEVRVVMVESQPLFGKTMRWRVMDAASGLVASGETDIASMRDVQPWPTGRYAEAFSPQSPAGSASPR